MSEVVHMWRFSAGLRLIARLVAFLFFPFVDFYALFYCITGRDGGVSIPTVLAVVAVSALFATLMIRLLQAEIALTEESIRYRNFSRWVEIPLADVAEFEIMRNGLRIVKSDETVAVAYALQRSLVSLRAEDAYILDRALRVAHR